MDGRENATPEVPGQDGTHERQAGLAGAAILPSEACSSRLARHAPSMQVHGLQVVRLKAGPTPLMELPGEAQHAGSGWRELLNDRLRKYSCAAAVLRVLSWPAVHSPQAVSLRRRASEHNCV